MGKGGGGGRKRERESMGEIVYFLCFQGVVIGSWMVHVSALFE